MISEVDDKNPRDRTRKKVTEVNFMEPLVITGNVKSCAYAVYAVMLAATLIVGILERVFKKDMTNFKLRLKSFWLIVILFTVAFSFNKLFAFFFLALINYLSLKEFFSLIQTRRADRRVLLWAYLAIPVQFSLSMENPQLCWGTPKV